VPFPPVHGLLPPETLIFFIIEVIINRTGREIRCPAIKDGNYREKISETVKPASKGRG
jgi:hypothetical protein